MVIASNKNEGIQVTLRGRSGTTVSHQTAARPAGSGQGSAAPSADSLAAAGGSTEQRSIPDLWHTERRDRELTGLTDRRHVPNGQAVAGP